MFGYSEKEVELIRGLGRNKGATMFLAAKSTQYRYWYYIEVDTPNCKYTEHDILEFTWYIFWWSRTNIRLVWLPSR